MQSQCAEIDFNYLDRIGLSVLPFGVNQIDMNDFVGPSWVREDLDELWCKNYEVNKLKNVKKFSQTNLANGKVVVLVGASPAALKQIKTLKSLSDNFIIVSCNTIYKKLINSGVRVDYVFIVEANSHIIDDISEQDERTTLIASQFVCPEILDLWKYDKWLYHLGGGNKFAKLLNDEGEEVDIGGGNSVSTAACWAYKYLNARDFILIGTSFCYYNKYYFDDRSIKYVCNFIDETQKVKAVDIYGDLVNVTPAQLMYKTWLENFIKEVPNACFTNSTEDGILGIVPEIISADRDGGQYRIHYLPWINIVPFDSIINAYRKKLKEIN